MTDPARSGNPTSVDPGAARARLRAYVARLPAHRHATHYDGRPLALTRPEAAEALGMKLTSFEKYVQPEVKLIRRGRLRLVPVSELYRWIDENAEATLRED